MPEQRVFLTGASGFAGSHLLDRLLKSGSRVYTLFHGASSHVDLPIHPRLTIVEGDLLDADSLSRAVRQAEPDAIYHLAGMALTDASWQRPALTMQLNAIGVINLLEAAVAFGRPRVVVVTSAEVYGPIKPAELPITEESAPRPAHPYGVSKLAASLLIPLYARRYQLPVVDARPFNHIGPRQANGFVVSDFASQLAAIKLGRRPPIMSVGNLDAERDFTDVRDVVDAYLRLSERGRPGQCYIICSGTAVSIREILDRLIALTGIQVEVRPDPTRMRPSETPRLVGSYQRLAEDTGWKPCVSLQQSLADALADWESRLLAAT
jgi:GDP-4-dehydro-6-deoxy-D-mannose reductase